MTAVTAEEPHVDVSSPNGTPPPTTSAPDDAHDEIASAARTRWDTFTPTHEPAHLPMRVAIAALGVDAPIAAAGVGLDGALELPDDTSTVAWFTGGAQPAEPGAVVLAAHVDHDGKPGVFFGLGDLAPGAALVVTTRDGSAHRYLVTSAPDNVKKSELALERVVRSTGPSTLVLITCGGRFDRTTRSYEDNTIVVASAIDD